MSNAKALMEELQKEIDKVNSDDFELTEDLEIHLIDAIHRTMDELSDPQQKSDYFHILALLNFLISTRQIPEAQVRQFLSKLKQTGESPLVGSFTLKKDDDE